MRFGRSHIVHENAYRIMESRELLGMVSERGDKETAEQLCKCKYMSDFSLEMTRSVAEYLKNFSSR